MISTHAPLAGRDVLVVSIGIKVFKFQPTRPLRGATESVPALATSDFLISTHAPLAGRDRGKGCTLLDSENFNPRAPCGARLQLKPQLFDFLDFNPRAPCGARRFSNDGFTIKICISTHAPLAGRDSKRVQITMHIFAITDKFQMLLHRMPPVRAFCSFLMQENHADFGCEPPK